MNNSVREDDLNEIEQLSSEVARLREADATATKAIDTLTAMHATSARSAKQWQSRVAELERKHGGDGPGSHAADLRALRGANAALDQARELLEYIESINAYSHHSRERARAWLRAHPATHAPAATGAEPEYPDSRDRCETDGALMHGGKCVQCGNEKKDV